MNNIILSKVEQVKNDSDYLAGKIASQLKNSDSYFEEKAITQFDRESRDIKDWLLMEFAEQFDGEKGRMKISQRIDEYITKSMDILDDPFTYREVFIHY